MFVAFILCICYVCCVYYFVSVLTIDYCLFYILSKYLKCEVCADDRVIKISERV